MWCILACFLIFGGKTMADPNTPMFAEMLKRAATEHADAVDPAQQPAPDVKPAGVSNIAKAIYAGGASADIGSTLYGFKHGYDEANPMINFAGNKAAIPISIAQEMGVYLLAKKLLGDQHPKIMNALVAGSGISHSLAALRNISTYKK